MDTAAHRLNRVPQSFIRKILKFTQDPDVISFAGGLPHEQTFPVAQLAQAAHQVYTNAGVTALQYSTTQGVPALREWIAQDLSQHMKGSVDPDHILITSGSQQALDLIGKAFVNPNDRVVIERPGYLGAIQALSLYEPEFIPVDLAEHGIDLQTLEQRLASDQPKLMYTVPSFQNPSGSTYSLDCRKALVELLDTYPNLILVEDNPYGKLRYEGEDLPLLKAMRSHNTILLGSFSKVVAPGLRLGWIYAEPDIIDRLNLVKQATDLHTSTMDQYILAQYLQDNDLDIQIRKTCQRYAEHRNTMIQALDTYMPDNIQFTRPQGGMFLWVTLPAVFSSMELFSLAIQEKVAFVPGSPFYVDGGGDSCLRLNFSNADPTRIATGIQKISRALEQMISHTKSKPDLVN